MLGVDRVGDRSSYAILTRNFLGEEAAQGTKTEGTAVWTFYRAISGAIAEELIPSLAERVQSGPEQSRVRPGRERSGP